MGGPPGAPCRDGGGDAGKHDSCSEGVGRGESWTLQVPGGLLPGTPDFNGTVIVNEVSMATTRHDPLRGIKEAGRGDGHRPPSGPRSVCTRPTARGRASHEHLEQVRRLNVSDVRLADPRT